MKFLISLVATVAAVFFGWKYTEAEHARIDSETRVIEVTRQLEEKTAELQSLRAATAGRKVVGGVQVTPGVSKPGLVEEKLRGYKNPLDTGTGDKLQRPQGR